ncbi:hypothetical protein [Sphingobium sp. YR768]|uniref:hypothetical protein n=1 Tax=Sphingobium sp. YR768 TaxID=1884365 RepID=UPI00115F8931|nr:hypothetical protein [Sphingobium sp. YR768]
MDYNALSDYLTSLQNKRSDNITIEYDEIKDLQYNLYDSYVDAIEFPMNHLRYGANITREEAHSYSRILCRLFSPSMIEQHLPAHRRAAAYRATSELAAAMERVAAGKRARKLFGIFG